MSNDPNASNSGTRQPSEAEREADKSGQTQRQGNQPPAAPAVEVDHPEGDVNINPDTNR